MEWWGKRNRVLTLLRSMLVMGLMAMFDRDVCVCGSGLGQADWGRKGNKAGQGKWAKAREDDRTGGKVSFGIRVSLLLILIKMQIISLLLLCSSPSSSQLYWAAAFNFCCSRYHASRIWTEHDPRLVSTAFIVTQTKRKKVTHSWGRGKCTCGGIGEQTSSVFGTTRGTSLPSSLLSPVSALTLLLLLLSFFSFRFG